MYKVLCMTSTMRNGIAASRRTVYHSECSDLRHSLHVARFNFVHTKYLPVRESLQYSLTRAQITSPTIVSRHYATSKDSEPPPFDSTGRDAKMYSNDAWLLRIIKRLFSGRNTTDGPWETRRDSEVTEGYEPDTEWESLQLLSNLIRKVKAGSEDTSELEDIEFQLKAAVDDLLLWLARDELPVVHVRLINEAWNFLYTQKIGNTAESEETDIVHSGDIPRQYFNRNELKKLLQLIVRYEVSSQYHVELGRKVYQGLMRMTKTEDKDVQEQFMLFVLLLSRNKADKEMLIAYNELLRILQSVDENMAVALVSIINNVSDEKVQEVLVCRLFQTSFLDIGAFNVILQAAIENDQRNIWGIYNQVLFPAQNTKEPLRPNLDTYELLFRYVVKDYEAEQSVSFMAHAKQVLFDENEVPAFDIIDNQSLYRSYLTACIVSGNATSAERIALYFRDDELLPHLEGETWRVLAQWVTYSLQEVSKINELLQQMNSYEFETDTATLNGIMRASQVGRSAEDFRNAVFSLYELYSVKLDTNAVGLRVRDRVRSGKPSEAVAVFKRGVSEGLTWHFQNDDMKALFVMLEGLATAEDFDADVLVEMYIAVRLYVNSVDYPTRLAMAKAFVDHGEVGNLRDLLNEEMGDSYKYMPDAFPELYDLLHRAVLNAYTGDAAWMLYGCIHSHFIPSYESYLPIMRHFCELDYCEATLELFRHIRKGTDTPPQRDMYALVFRQFARRNFVSGINELFHCYKVDLNIDPDIELFNAMLEACSPSSHDYLSYSLWQQIRLNAAAHPTEIIHQPNTETLRLLLKVASHTGAGYADMLWDEFKKYPVPLTAEHFKYYIAAHCEAKNFDRAFQIARHIFNLAPPEPTPDSSEDASVTAGDAIGVLYNYIESENMRKEVEEWATTVHPDEWKKVKRIGPLMQRLDIRGYNILSNPLEQARLEKVREGLLPLSQEYSRSRPTRRADLPKASAA
ncbi:hypothetical protein V1504DRAFT_71724 [Lipomyces starkeyi]